MGFKPTTFRLQVCSSNNGATEPMRVVHNCESLYVHTVDVCDQYITGCIQKLVKRIP